jgi:hypothetical protein
MSTGLPCAAISSAGNTIFASLPLLGQRLGQRREAAFSAASRLRGQRLRPVERQVEVAAAVVDAGRPCAPATCRCSSGTCRWLRRASRRAPWRGVAGRLRRGARATPPARGTRRANPSAGSSRQELLHVLGRRAAGAGLEQAAAVHQRHDRQHLGAGAQLQDREQVGQVVAQHVAGDRDGVEARGGCARARSLARLDRRQDADVQALGVVLGEVLSRPWRSGCASCARLASSQNTAGCSPVRRARFTASLTQSRIGASLVWHMRQMSPALTACSISTLPAVVDHAHGDRRPAISKVLSCEPYSSAFCAIRPTFGTEPIVAGSNAPLRLAVVDDGLVDAGVAAVGNHRLGVLQLAVGVPHLAEVADHRRHRGVDDHVARHVQVGDALVGVDHRQRRAAGVGGLRCRPRSPRSPPAASASRRQVAEAVVDVDAELGQRRACFSNTSAKNTRTAWPNMIGSETFIMVAFRCSENSTPSGLRVGDLLRIERPARLAHEPCRRGSRRQQLAVLSFSTVSCRRRRRTRCARGGAATVTDFSLP